MSTKKFYTKEDVKDRLFRNAANFWGIRNIDNLDPMVKLLVEAFASEVYKLSNEVNNMETRLLERTASLLTPDILMSVRPAHTILQVYPLEAHSLLNKTTGFYYDDAVFNMKHQIKNISFYPVGAFPLVKGQVRNIICGGNLYTYDKFHIKEITARSTQRSEIFAQTIWIGLDLHQSVDSIENLSFYFDLLNIENKLEYLHLLPFSQWEFKNSPLQTDSGIFDPNRKQESSSIYKEYDLANISDNSIIENYNHHFITLKNQIKNNKENLRAFPEELIELFPSEIIKNKETEKPLLWIKISFPPNFSEDVLEAMSVSINAFPVANKSLKKQYVKINKLTNIVPLETEAKEHFLSMSMVTDSQNRTYNPLPYRDSNGYQSGTYTIKRGGVERFDSRNAKEYILNLIDLLRDESVAYSIMGKGFLSGLTRQLEELIATIDQRMNEVNEVREIPSYLILDAEEKDEIIFVDYWITHCDIINGIKAGSYLIPYSETFVEADKIFTLTPTSGGRGLPKTNNMLDMYKYILTSRDRVYTNEDIINFCYSTYGDLISGVEVKKGVQVGSKPKEGLIRTIDVFIKTYPNFNLFSSENELKEKIFNQLQNKSPETYNYRIFIN